MFEKTNAFTLFPTLVWAHDLPAETAQRLNGELEAAIDRLLTPRPPLAPRENWQTEQDLHLRPEFAELVRYIQVATTGVLNFLTAEHEGFEITGCWANIGPEGASHRPHFHPNNYLSGVYYVRSAPGGDQIHFLDPRAQVSMISPRYRERTPANCPDAFLQALEGRLLLFPAWLRHAVPANRSGRERISIAFNLQFTDFTRRVARPKWEGIKLRDKGGE